MDTTEFVALPVARLRASILVAERHGWKARFDEEIHLREAGIRGRLVRITNPDSPFPLILFRSDAGAALAAVRHNGYGSPWVELVDDAEVTEEIVDDAPVAAHLVTLLAAERPQAAASGATAA